MSFPQRKHARKEIAPVARTPNGKSVSLHHRKPRSIGGTEEERNKIILLLKLHRYWHGLFGNWPAARIAQEITERYLDPDYIMVAVRKKDLPVCLDTCNRN